MKRHQVYKCEDCQEVFHRFQELVAHRRVKHPKLHVCSDCGKAYRRLQFLQDHQKRVHAAAVFVCPEPGCGKVLSSADGMRMHHRTIHLGLRPFTCRLCKQEFSQRFVLQRHMQCVHAGDSTVRQRTPAVAAVLPQQSVDDSGSNLPSPAAGPQAPASQAGQLVRRKRRRRQVESSEAPSQAPSAPPLPDNTSDGPAALPNGAALAEPPAAETTLAAVPAVVATSSAGTVTGARGAVPSPGARVGTATAYSASCALGPAAAAPPLLPRGRRRSAKGPPRKVARRAALTLADFSCGVAGDLANAPLTAADLSLLALA